MLDSRILKKLIPTVFSFLASLFVAVVEGPSFEVLSDWGELACIPALEKEMATHSSVLAWRIPGMEEPGGLPSMGSHGVGHDWSDLAAAAASAISLNLLGGSVIKNLPAMQETQVRSLGREDPLEEEMATHFSTLAWKNPMDGGA